jgi:hypothetical protein
MKKKIVKRLHEIIIEIINADEEQLNVLGAELLEIEKKLLKYTSNQKEK